MNTIFGASKSIHQNLLHFSFNPVRAHVEVMPGGDESNQSTNVQGSLPVTLQVLGLHEEEHGGANHSHGDDPESNTNEIVGSQELGGGLGEVSVDVSDLAVHGLGFDVVVGKASLREQIFSGRFVH